MNSLFKKTLVSLITSLLLVSFCSNKTLFSSEKLKSNEISQNVLDMASVIKKVGRGKIKNPVLLAKVILKECKKHNFDPLLIVALIHQESSFRSHIFSHKSAIGLMQLKHSTAQEMAKKLKWSSLSKQDLLNPITNVQLGIHYLGKLKKQFLNNRILFLTAYNNGPTRIKFLLKTLPKNELKFIYANKILKIYSSLKKEYRPSEFPVSMTVAFQQ